jgi:hypothetical protein
MMDENQDTNMNRDQNQEEEMQPTEQNPVESDGRSGGAEFAARLEACEAKANEYLEGWQRSRAEFSNYKKRMAKIIGIDLGTTNSVVAVMEGGEPVVIPSAEGNAWFLRWWQSTKTTSGWSGGWPATRRSSTLKTPFSRSSASWAASSATPKCSALSRVPYKVAEAPMAMCA